MEEPPAAAAMVAVLTNDALIYFILKRLSPMDLVRAALTCHRWRRAAFLAISRVPPLMGYFIRPRETGSLQPMSRAELPAVFIRRDASAPRLSLPLTPDDSPDLAIHDVHLGLVLLLPGERPETLLRGMLVLDPASRRRVLLPPPSLDAMPAAQTRLIIGAAVLSRAHPSRLNFEAVCVTLEEDRPRAWVAFVRDDDPCSWRALPRSKQAAMGHLHPLSLEKRCVHAGAHIYWRIANSGPVLSLDCHSKEFSLGPAPGDLGPDFGNDGIGRKPEDGWCMTPGLENDCQIFPYYLCWPPDFLATLKGDAWTENVMNLIRIAVHNICYIRGLFEKTFFCDMFVAPAGLRIKRLVPLDEESQRLSEWLDKGICDALQRKYLRIILFSIFEEAGALIEEYSLSFSYGENIGMTLWLTGCTESMCTLTCNAAESFPNDIWSSACTLVQTLVSVMSTCDKIPRERIIMMKLLYYDDVTPLNYEPPFFQCCDDISKVSYQPQQTDLQDVIRDMGCLPCEMSSDDHGNKDIALGVDNKTPEGYLYCITRKKVNFYFDSGASYHMCCDLNLIRNLRDVPDESRAISYDVDGDEIFLNRAGEVVYGQIRLHPVFFAPNLNYNVISLGELDDGNNLICLGDQRIKIFDIREGIMIGEGYMHKERNEYLARSITSIKELRKATDTTSESSTAAGTDTASQPSTVAEKNIWIVDSLCNNHMTGNRMILRDRRSETKSFTTPKGKIKATEIGTVRTRTLTLFNVYYCPGISSNIISEGQLDRDGYSCTRFAHKVNIQCRVTQDTVGVAHQDENFLYYVDHCHYVNDPSLNQSKDDRPSKKKAKCAVIRNS